MCSAICITGILDQEKAVSGELVKNDHVIEFLCCDKYWLNKINNICDSESHRKLFPSGHGSKRRYAKTYGRSGNKSIFVSYDSQNKQQLLFLNQFIWSKNFMFKCCLNELQFQRVGKVRNAFRILVGKPERKKPHWRHRRGWRGRPNIERDEKWCWMVIWIYLTQVRD